MEYEYANMQKGKVPSKKDTFFFSFFPFFFFFTFHNNLKINKNVVKTISSWQ